MQTQNISIVILRFLIKGMRSRGEVLAIKAHIGKPNNDPVYTPITNEMQSQMRVNVLSPLKPQDFLYYR